ncbi:hypothetical protein GE21DRAFT_6551 [Neurospora crassa]|uniref:Uncharacterized protein n=1 Tax=Neurospora crassa (strain ATCC 24698 / 74-OR23-1A / CBS 708.71 / DSM 1257 / FGSC 987) TaxID=367110 RepID=Q7S8X8_NEUCR|nr:hypothetical protein NCU08837 [Neurospora crassa OR74A]EAA32812.1 hypothetical protein NCU08837 [Neurospora crassa OR74A]KHE79774.1 hypothetical protein GE21DRAFT_6551 [Neurospora crassa]|eukprot:XP_962048.1 hypothetical protein NCU08837 [Neurospora crassa OR74A]
MMEDKKEHPLLTRFPDDADWEEFDNLSLLRQCLVRGIPSEEISRDNKILLLQNFSKKHVTEIRKIPWRRSPSRFTREEKSLRLNKATYQIAKAKNTSNANKTVFWTEFTLSDEKGSTCVVAFKEVPSCTCPSQPTLLPAATTEVAAVTATTTTTTITPGVPTPKANIVHQYIERKEKDDHGVSSSSSFNKQADRDTRVTDNSGVNQRPSHTSQSSSLLSSSSSNIPTLSQSNTNEQELLISSHSQQTSTSKDILPQLKSPTPASAVSLQRSTSAPPTSNSEPMRLELKQHKAQERAEKSPRGVSQDCNPAPAKSLSSVPSAHYPNSNASAPRANTPEQAGPTPVLSADGVDSRNAAATTAAFTAQTATPVSPDDIPGNVGCSSPASVTDADVHRRKVARLVRKCRHLERKSARIGKHVKRGMDKIDREYKLELMMLKEKRKIKYIRIEKKWEHDLKGLKHQREKLEEKLKDLD